MPVFYGKFYDIFLQCIFSIFLLAIIFCCTNSTFPVKHVDQKHECVENFTKHVYQRPRHKCTAILNVFMDFETIWLFCHNSMSVKIMQVQSIVWFYWNNTSCGWLSILIKLIDFICNRCFLVNFMHFYGFNPIFQYLILFTRVFHYHDCWVG